MSLLGGIDVFNLLISAYSFHARSQTAQDETAAQADDGGTPPEPVGPGVVITPLEDLLVEIDGVDDQADELEDH